MRPACVAALALTVAVLTSCANGSTNAALTQATTTAGRSGIVERIIDGDTLDVREAPGKLTRTRILGLNAPEVGGHGHPAQCGGKTASDRLTSAIQGKRVSLVTDPTQTAVDRYGRLLAYVELDRRDVGAALIEGGWAAAYWPKSSKTPLRGPAYTLATAKARAAKTGLWATCGTIERPTPTKQQ